MTTAIIFSTCWWSLPITAIASTSKSRQRQFYGQRPFCKRHPRRAGNLVLKARDALRQHGGPDLSPVAIHLEKNLPIASGIGGGSSDAAATLLALNTLWQLDLDFEMLAAIGLSLGADLPMCLHGAAHGTPLIARGIGEELNDVSGIAALPMLLVNDGTALATPDVFRALTRRENAPCRLRPVKGQTPFAPICVKHAMIFCPQPSALHRRSNPNSPCFAPRVHFMRKCPAPAQHALPFLAMNQP